MRTTVRRPLPPLAGVRFASCRRAQYRLRRRQGGFWNERTVIWGIVGGVLVDGDDGLWNG
jgi:hypothetical protein